MTSLLLVLLLAGPPADLTAVGVVNGPHLPGSAVLRSAGRTRVVSVGDTAFGGKVVAIGARTVALEYEGRRVEIPLVSTAPERPALAAAPTSSPDASKGPKTLERREVERRLGEEVPRILAETAVSPVSSDGRVTGLAITRLPEGTVLSEAGLQAGDILTKINDTPIDGLPTLMGLWGRLQGASEVHAEVLRNGQPVSLSVSLR
jgi:type II secretion system protein C